MRAVLLCVLCLSVIPAFAVTISGRAVDVAGNPVADAEIWVVPRAFSPGEPVIIASTRTAADGSFRLENLDLAPRLNSTQVSLVGHKPGLAICGPVLSQGTTDLDVVFAAPVPLSLRVVDPEGKPVRAKVRANWAYSYDTATRQWVSIPSERKDQFTVTTDETGTVSIPWGDGNLRWQVEIDAEGYGLITARLDPDHTEPVVLQPACTVRGRLTCEAAPAQVAGRRVLVGTPQTLGDAYSQQVCTTDAEGRFEAARLAPGQVHAYLSPEPDAAWSARPVTAEALESGETADIELPLEKTYEIRGRAVAEDTGLPIQGLGAYASGIGIGGGFGPVTDAEGVFRLRVLPGPVSVNLNGTVGNYTASWDASQKDVTVVDADVDVGDFAVPRGVSLRGIVVDQAGRPVPGAEVQYRAEEYGPFHGPTTTCDDGGAFELKGLSKGREVTLRARKGTAMTTAPVKATAGENDQVTVPVQENAAVQLRVRVVGNDEQPLAGAKVAFMWQTEQMGAQAETGTTGPDGAYLTKPQWPEGTYNVSALAAGHSQAQATEWKAAAGETHDFGDLTLIAARASVAGVVVDAEGKPVAGARVTCNQGGPEGVRTTADAEGRWRVEQLFDGLALVVAEKRDLLGAGWFPTGAEDARIVVAGAPGDVALGEPKPLVQPDTEEQTAHRRAVARELIDKGLALWKGKGEDPDRQLVCLLARLDEERAFELAPPKHYDSILWSLAEAYLPTDPEEAEACAWEIGDDSMRVMTLLQIASTVARKDPDRTRRIVEDTMPQALTLAPPGLQAMMVAQCATALGRTDLPASEPLARRAAEMAANLGASGYDSGARMGAAAALCPFDLEAAVALTSGLKEDHEKSQALMDLARRLAPIRPDEAVELVQQARLMNSGPSVSAVVYLLAPEAPDKALELARASQVLSDRAVSLGYVALALRPTDAAKALEVFEEAVSSLWQSRGARDNYESGRIPSAMAAMAQIGVQVGYPGIDRLVTQTWALVPAPERGPWLMDYRDRQDTDTLVALSFVAPEAVRPLLDSMRAKVMTASLEDYYSPVEAYFAITGHIDPDLARDTMNALLARFSGPTPPPESALRTLRKAAERILVTPEERYREAMRNHSGFLPGDEDRLGY